MCFPPAGAIVGNALLRVPGRRDRLLGYKQLLLWKQFASNPVLA
jgi:hypothetical protein